MRGVLPIGFALLGLAAPVSAADFTWIGTDDTDTWSDAANWSPSAIAAGGTAVFDSSDSLTSIYDLEYFSISALRVSAPAGPLTLRLTNNADVTFTGSGISNTSTNLLTIVGEGVTDESQYGAIIVFNSNTATAGGSNVYYDNNAAGNILFLKRSSAGSATFYNHQYFTPPGINSTRVSFDNTATAGSSHIINEGASSSSVDNRGAETYFKLKSTAANATIESYGGSAENASGSSTYFFDSSTGANATLINYGGTAEGAWGGSTNFSDTAKAGNATIIAYGGTNGGLGGGIFFSVEADGSGATVKLYGNGYIDLSWGFEQFTSIGSVEGDGEIHLGTGLIEIGALGTSTTFSGLIRNGGLENYFPGDAAIRKVGSGTLTLTGTQSTYSGSTSIIGGVLEVTSLQNTGEASTLGTGTGGQILISNGTLRYIGSEDAVTDRAVQIGLDAAGDTGTVEASGTGTLTLADTADLLFGTVDQTRTLVLGGSNTGRNTMATTITDNGTGAVSLRKTGQGTWVLSSSNTYSGGTTLTSGTLVVSHSGAVGTGAVAVNGGVFHVENGVTISNTVTLGGGTYARTLSGSLANAMNATSNLGGRTTSAALLDGTLASATTLVTSFSATSSALNDSSRLSDIYSLSGMQADPETGETSIFVLQLSFTSTATDSYLGWLNTQSNTWVNAIDGNIGNVAEFAGESYVGTFATFQSANGTILADYIGAHGWYQTGNTTTVWAVLNHNSDFAAIPEPGTWLLLAFSLSVVVFWRVRPRNSA